jgi:ribosomal protein L21E
MFCPPPPRKLRKCQLRKRYQAHRRERAYYKRRWSRYREWERVHIVDGTGVVRSAMVQRFAGQHGWVDVKELEIRITSGYATVPLAQFMKGV